MPKNIGRNDPCPCGSGKKYKRCCLGKDTIELKKKKEHIESAQRIYQEILKKERKRKRRYGDTRPMISEEFQGERFVAVGNTLYSSSAWLSPLDFLKSFLVDLLIVEFEEPLPDNHPISEWFNGMQRFHKFKNPCMTMVRAQPNGLMKSFLLLANDLYTVRHNLAYHKSIIKRLAPINNFHGARYELFAAATCIRAGFKIEYEDETDPTTTHPEFYAVHKATGQRIAVEAKTRDRPGVLGQPGLRESPEDINIGVSRALKKALRKKVTDPFIIFIDLNLPVGMAVYTKPEVKKQIDRTVEEHNKPLYLPDPYSLILLTDHPYHYDESNNPAPKGGFFYVPSNSPMIKIQHREALDAIISAAEQFWNIPYNFDE